MERFTICEDPNLDLLIHKLNNIGLLTIMY